MRSFARTASVLALALAASPLLLRADTYNFNITAGPQSSTLPGGKVDPSQLLTIAGTLSGPADPTLAGGFDITSITGGASGDQFAYSFAGVVAPGTTNSQTPGSFAGYTFDNVLHTGGGLLTSTDGFLVYLDSSLGQSLAHVFATSSPSNNGFPYEVTVSDPGDPSVATPFAITSFTVSPSAVPEPSTLALLATGALGGVGALRRRLSASKTL